MKSFKQYIKDKSDVPSIETPIHFKHVVDEKKKKKHSLKEEVHHPDYDWTKDPDNRELGSTSKEISKKIEKNGFDYDQRVAVRKYTNVSSPLNRHLIDRDSGKEERYMTPEQAKDHEDHAKVLDSAIDSNRIDHKLHAYSGVHFDPEKLKNKDGHFRSPAFISATHDKKVAHRFASRYTPSGESSHIIHFELNPGDPAAHVSHLSVQPEEEHETLIKRGVVMKHHSTTEIHGVKIHRVSIHSES